jgi:DUF438 domain-containing protein
MDKDTLRLILDALAFPVVFVDADHTIRFLNRRARFHYCEERGYRDLVGASIFACHNEQSKERIMGIVEKLKNHGREMLLAVNEKNERVYVTPSAMTKGKFIGYFERFERKFSEVNYS